MVKKEGRIEYIDVIETFAIFFVIYCHYAEIMGTSSFANVVQLLSSTAVPLFFLANGALLFSKPGLDLKKHLKKTVLLFFSVVFWKAVYLIAMFIRYSGQQINVSKFDILYYFSGDFDIANVEVAASHFWFMYALIGVYLLFPFLKIAYDNYKSIINYIMIFLLIFVFFFTEYNTWIALISEKTGLPIYNLYVLKNAVFPFAQGGNYILYFLLGGVIHQSFYKADVGRKTKMCLLAGIIVSYAVLVFEKYIQEGTLSGNIYRLQNDYSRLSMLIFVTLTFAFLASLNISRLKGLNKIFEFISVRTMNIYAVHMLLCVLFVQVAMPNIMVRGVKYNLLRTLLVMVVSIIVTEPLTYIPGVRCVLGLKPFNAFKKVALIKKLDN